MVFMLYKILTRAYEGLGFRVWAQRFGFFIGLVLSV